MSTIDIYQVNKYHVISYKYVYKCNSGYLIIQKFCLVPSSSDNRGCTVFVGKRVSSQGELLSCRWK